MAGEASSATRSWLYHPEFPAHWERRPLYSMAQWVNGLAFRDIQFSPTGKPVIKIAEIKGGISDQTKFTNQAFDESVHVRFGDLLFSWSGQPETSIDVFWWRGPDGWLNQHSFRVTPAVDVDRTFFFFLLRYLKPNFIGIARNKQTTGLGHVTKRDLESIEAALPGLPEQRAIAHFLGTLDDKIELNRRMSETLEALARALFTSLFVSFDPVRAKAEGRDPGLPKRIADLYPDSFEDSELGEIPKGWKVGCLGSVVEVLRDQDNPLESPGTQFAHHSIPAFDEGQEPKRELGATIKSLKFRVPAGTVLLSKLNPEIERVWLVDVQPDDRAVCSTEFLVMQARQPFTRSWVYCFVRSIIFRQQIEGLVTGTSKSHQRAQADSVLKLGAIVPPEPILAAFERVAGSLLTRTLTCRSESRALKGLRDALLTKLISGELRVPRSQQLRRQPK
jgi:type I restriction enzyme S subunit